MIHMGVTQGALSVYGPQPLPNSAPLIHVLSVLISLAYFFLCSTHCLHSLPANYKPVSLTSLCCKLLERIIKVDVTKHLIHLGLITDDQHGFREGRSCCTQLLQIMEICTDMFDHGQAWDCIYLDFAKAFDSVPHKRLLNKLHAYGITGKLLKWVEDFLTDRQQRVIVAHEKILLDKSKVRYPTRERVRPTTIHCIYK